MKLAGPAPNSIDFAKFEKMRNRVGDLKVSKGQVQVLEKICIGGSFSKM